MKLFNRHFSAFFIILTILIWTFGLPVSVAHARVQNISITKLVDEPDYKETFFIIAMNEKTYHILVTATIHIVGSETFIELTATLVNPHNTTIVASARIPDILTDVPYLAQSVEAFPICFPDWVVDALKVALPIVMVVALVVQVYMILESIIENVLEAILDIVLFGNFIFASLPWVLLTLLNDENPDGSVDLYIPYSPFWEHFTLLMERHYFVATSLSWWQIVEQEVYTDICIPIIGCYRIVWFTYYVVVWNSSREPEPPPEPPEYPPHASFEYEPNQPTVDEEVVFTSTSFDPDGFIATYHWWLGDGNESMAKNSTHSYSDSGNYSVTLEVTDSDGLSDNVTQNVSVQLKPEARLRVIPSHLSIDLTRGQDAASEFIAKESLNQIDLLEVTFQASDLKNPDGDIIVSGNVTFDKNGITIGKGSFANVTVTFHAPTNVPTGWYNGNITVFSENGGDDTIYVDLLISTPLCELTVTSSPITGIPYTMNESEKITPHTQVLPEGFYTLEMPQSHNGYVWSHWLEDGDPNRTKTITLPGTTWTGVFAFAVQPHGPEAEFTAIPDTALTDESIKFDASASSPGWNDTHEMPIVEYRWDFGDGNQTTTSTPIVYHGFSSSGIYYVTLTVYAPGATPETDSTTHKVTITAIPVGGYSFPIKGYTTEKPLTLYLALIAILTAGFTMIKRKTPRRSKRSL